MTQFIVRNLEDDIRDQLRKLARNRGQSMEETFREILRGAVLKPDKSRIRLGTCLAARFATNGLQQEIVELRGDEILPLEFDR